MNSTTMSMKEKILRVAAKIIAQKGIKAASTRAICVEAEITAPTLYYYFRNKNELLNAVTSWAFDKHTKHVIEKTKQPSAKQKLNELWNSYIDFALQEQELFTTMILAITNGNIPSVAAECFVQLQSTFQELGEQGKLKCDYKTSTHAFLATAHGLASLYLSSKKSANNDTAFFRRSQVIKKIMVDALLIE